MRYRVLGTTHAFRDDGAPVAVGGARLRALLAALAVRPGRTVPVHALVAQVWDGDPPADGVAALQALIGRLRRALGHTAVESGEGGYRLCAAEDDVDAYRFTRLAAEGTRALEAGDPVKASTLLSDALALWQGPALADLPDGTSEATRWETRRKEAHRTHLAASLALGRADEVLPELTALCDEFPLDERVQALRIRALRDAGRPAEALAAYEGMRQGLASRLGADPGPELRALHGELLTLAPASPPRTPRVPSGGGGTGGPGGRTASGSSTAGAAGSATAGAEGVRTPEAGPPHVPGNLRARLTSFVGREADIAALHEDLARARLVTLLGPGGAGKTRLSQEAAEAAGSPAYPDGVWLAELAPVEDPATVPEAVLTALRARETVLRGAGAEGLRAADPHAGEPLALLAEHLGRRRMLLILDNCEHVVGAAAEVAEALLTRCPGLTVLATSREPLGVPGEVVRPVGALGVDAAFRLFAERGRAVRPGFVAGEDRAAVGEICRRLDGLPLAIELAAARLRVLSPRQIADRLDDRFRLLSRGSRTVLPRQQTLRAVVDWSWDLLDASERAVLRRLSVFAGGCDLAAAEAVCTDTPDYADTPDHADTSEYAGTPDRAGTPEAPGSRPRAHDDDIATVLGSLVDKSLVVAVPAARPDTGMRYRLLETVAEYAAERLDEAGDRAATERGHLVHYRELARTTDPLLRGAGQRAALDLLTREYENLRTALRRAQASRDEHEVLCLVLSLSWYWQMLDQRSEARHWAAGACELGPDPFAEPARPAPPIHQRCIDAPPPMSDELLEEARREVRLFEMLNADLSGGVWLAGHEEWLHTVARVYRAGLPQTCRPPGMFWLLALLFTGDEDGVTAAMDETARACEEFGLEWDLASILQMRANFRANRGAFAESAARDAERALAIFERLGDAWGTAESLSARGEAYEKLGRHADAAADYVAAVRYAEGLGALHHVELLRVRLAQNLVELGRGAEAEAMLHEVLDAHGAEDSGTSNHDVVPITRVFLATWLGRSGRRQEAREQLFAAQQSFGSGPLLVFQGLVRSALSWLDVEDGAFGQALERIRASLEEPVPRLARLMAPEMGAVQVLIAARALAGVALTRAAGPRPGAGAETGAEAGTGRTARDAARLLGAYEALLPVGHVRSPFEAEVFQAAEKETLTALSGDAAAHAEARAAGAVLSLEEATALV
ncbi:AfsR/SARP family transcriptional regulator [Streptomyces sp. NBC_01497]|uniref:AfsR/SARP family transcriptional regulator n=1 Tax=Streptomyces sp. NBC_01497 TaxID=2903885 RepID=UPI002E3740AC|nr:BTAD domain-containing putative transcriptional regulator [Streptomyces sp. NBC_01497]